MLVNMNEVLLPAKRNHYAVGLFNAVNLELARGIIAAAESTGSPVIMGTAEILFPYGPLEEVSYYLHPMAKKARVPVVIHLDHGLRRETCIQALERFTSADKGLTDLIPAEVEAVRQETVKKMKLFGSDGKAIASPEF